jgi:tRNA(Ile2) C34 agmatinyltransferase TiaS
MTSTELLTKSTPTCPFCHSDDVGTTAKAADDSAYWRCRACGEIWSPNRLKNFRVFRAVL